MEEVGKHRMFSLVLTMVTFLYFTANSWDHAPVSHCLESFIMKVGAGELGKWLVFFYTRMKTQIQILNTHVKDTV